MQDRGLVVMSKWHGARFHLVKKKQKAFLSSWPIFYISLQMWNMRLMARYQGKTRTITGVADSDVVPVRTVQSSEHIQTCNTGCFLSIGPCQFQHRIENDLWPTQVLSMEFSIWFVANYFPFDKESRENQLSNILYIIIFSWQNQYFSENQVRQC